MKSSIYRVLSALAATFIMGVGSALACTTSAWTGGESGAVNANDPNNSVQRLSGFCGLQVTGQGHVQDDNPTAETSFYARFYFLPQYGRAARPHRRPSGC